MVRKSKYNLTRNSDNHNDMVVYLTTKRERKRWDKNATADCGRQVSNDAHARAHAINAMVHRGGRTNTTDHTS